MKVGLVDYGMGNLASVERALRAACAGVEVVRVTRARDLAGTGAVVLPGVGAFAAAMEALERQGLAEALLGWLEAGRPLLGICLGYQLLFSESEEAGAAGGRRVPGLGWLAGRVRRFGSGVTAPHMGWNRLELTDRFAPLFAASPAGPGPHAYFAHSFYPEPDDPGVVSAWCTVAGRNQTVRFAAAAWRGAAGGVQFHPEKSGRRGLEMLAAFVKWAARAV